MIGAAKECSASPLAVRVVTADAQPLFGDAIGRAVRACSSFELVGQAGDARGALRLLRELRPDVAVVAARLDGVDGRRILTTAASQGVATRLVFITDDGDRSGAYDLLEQGAAGCLTRTTNSEQLHDAIRAVAGGGVFLAHEIQHVVVQQIRLRAIDDRPAFNPREHEVLRRIADGQSVPTIARAMHLSIGSVRTHLAHIYDKLGVSERAAAVAAAMRLGLLD